MGWEHHICSCVLLCHSVRVCNFVVAFEVPVNLHVSVRCCNTLSYLGAVNLLCGSLGSGSYCAIDARALSLGRA
jgi:hypothetical protein